VSSRSALPVDFRLYLITDRGATAGREFLDVVEEALIGGVRGVQLREKSLTSREYLDLARSVRALTARYGARLLINDRLDIVQAVGADGVHLPEAGLPVTVARKLLGSTKLIGVSCHGLEGAQAAEFDGADFITFGPVYHTSSKASYGAPVGVTSLQEVTRALAIPVFALGGITRDRITELSVAGIRRIACISALLSASAPRAEAQVFTALLGKVA
jgi:thiamine-phosphate pyrophosphorylase